jgi:hypothetical protein
MKPHFNIQHRGGSFSFIPPSDDRNNCQFGIRTENDGGSATILTHFHPSCRPEDLVALCLLHRAIGSIIDHYQPGIVSPLPDGDSSEVDAMKVLFEVDRLWREGNAEVVNV